MEEAFFVAADTITAPHSVDKAVDHVAPVAEAVLAGDVRAYPLGLGLGLEHGWTDSLTMND